jgi:hypothetical protein
MVRVKVLSRLRWVQDICAMRVTVDSYSDSGQWQWTVTVDSDSGRGKWQWAVTVTVGSDSGQWQWTVTVGSDSGQWQWTVTVDSDSRQPDCSGKKTVPVPFFAPQISRGPAKDRKWSPRLEARDKPPQPCKDCKHYMKSTPYITNQIVPLRLYDILTVERLGNAV